MLRIYRILLTSIRIAALVGFFAVCVFILIARYWILPHIDTWRPDITQFISSRLQVDFQATGISAQWRGANPSFTLTGVSLSPVQTQSPAPRPVLNIPKLSAQLRWRSLFTLKPVFSHLDASGIHLGIQRDKAGKLHALGRTFDPVDDQGSDGLLGSMLEWLQAQKTITLSDSAILWTDDMRGAPPLSLDRISLSYASRWGKREISVSAMPPAKLGERLDARIVISTLRDTGMTGPAPEAADNAVAMRWPDMDAQLYIKLGGMRPGAWAPWVDLSRTLSTAQFSAQARLDVDHGKLQTLTTDVQLTNANWHPGDGMQISASALQLYLTGPAQDYLTLLLPDAQSADQGRADAALSYRFLSRNLQFYDAKEFSHPLDLGSVLSRGQVGQRQGGKLHVVADEAGVANQYGRATLRGSWQEGGTSAAGMIDVTGNIEHASITSVANYLPAQLNAHVADWLKHGLLAGQLYNANLVLKGDLAHFPFHEAPSMGDFTLTGPYRDAIIDYLPPHGNELGWPQLESMRGTLSLHGADLKLTASEAITRTAKDKEITLRNVLAHIPDLEHDAVLSVQGDTSGAADAYLALMTHSPLGALLGNVLDKASATGNWSLPLSLTIPLADARQTAVGGKIQFDGNSVRLSPDLPVLSDAKGELAFTQESVSTSDLNGQFLGGAMKLSGKSGVPGKSLRLQGKVTADALAQYVGLEGMKRLKGSTSYVADIERQHTHDLTVTVTSDLTGLSADLPEPLNKSAKSAMPLKVQWKMQGSHGTRELQLQLGNDIKALLLRRGNDAKRSSFFDAGSLAINEPLQLPSKGLRLDIRSPVWAMDSWRAVQQAFEQPTQVTGRREKSVPSGINAQQSALLPPLTYLRLQSERATFHGLVMDKATVTAQQPQPDHWRLDVSSTQTAGTVQWKETDGSIRGAVDAAFDRLDIGSVDADKDAPPEINTAMESSLESASAQEKDLLAPDDVLDLPAVNLHIKRLRLYGHYAGELSVTGVNASRGQLWRLQNFHLGSAHAAISGTGSWQLAGKQRGLTINAHANIKNLGDYLTEAGYPELIIDGRGTLDGQLRWHNMPWAFKRSDVDGNLRFDLSKGRFSNVNSHSAQLLELLSLQSVSRLARLKFNPSSLVRDGFPFDTLRGSVASEQGVLSTKDYRVVGPAGTIVLEGTANLVDENLDMQAVVVPNLDMSGATIAAGIAINPIVGVSAFLAQWLLQAPLSQAMASQYHITGDWSKPQIQESAAPPARTNPSFKKVPEH